MHTEAMIRIYGHTEKLDALLTGNYSGTVQAGVEPIADETGTIESMIKDLRNMRQKLLCCSEDIVARTMLQEESLAENYEPEKTFLLQMILKSALELEEYSFNLLHNGKAAHEDTYNRTMKKFFSHTYSGFLNYQIEEQVQIGTTGKWSKNGENGMGRLDLLIKRLEQNLCLIEGIRLSELNTAYIDEHVRRLYKYNASRVPMAVMIVYATVHDVSGLWDKYVEYLKKPKPERWGSWHFVGTGESILGFLRERDVKLPFICKMIHTFRESGLEMEVYHVMIDVGKKSQTEIHP